MALPGPRPAPGPAGPLAPGASPDDASLAEAVEVYRRTYTTVLRSTGETRLRVLEASHKAMRSSLHALADSREPDLGAFLYAVRRLPEAMFGAERVVMGQSAEIFARRGFGSFSDADGDRRSRAAAALVRRRRRDARRAHRVGVGRRRPGPHAGGVPDRVEQAARRARRQPAARAARRRSSPRRAGARRTTGRS